MFDFLFGHFDLELIDIVDNLCITEYVYLDHELGVDSSGVI